MIMAFVVACLLVGCKSQVAEEEGQKIVLLSADLIPLMEQLEIDSIVGIVDESKDDWPTQYQNVTLLTLEEEDISAIVETSPTLVIGTVAQEEQAHLFVEQQIDSVYLNMTTLPQVMQSIKELGPVIDADEKAEEVVEEFLSFVKGIHGEIRDLAKKKVMIVTSFDESYQVATENTFIGSMVKLMGGINVFGDANSEGIMAVSEAEINTYNPQIILVINDNMLVETLKETQAFQEVTAISEENVVCFNLEGSIEQANLQYSESMQKLQEIFYPE